MAFTVQKALEIVRHAGYSSTSLPALDYVNEAGRRLCMMRPWWWMQAPPITLGVRAPFSITGATWTEATKTLGLAAAFTDYVHAHGDVIDITAGTSTTLRQYVIEERLSANGVRLSESIGASASAVAGTVLASSAVIMPSNFGGQLNAYTTTSNINEVLSLVSQQELINLRAGFNLPSAGHYVGAMFVGMNLTLAGGDPSYRLELYPRPTAANPDLFTLSYQYAWKAAETDTSRLRLPEWIDSLFVEVLRAVVNGYEAEESGSVTDRLNAVRTGATYHDAVAHDSLMQPTFGRLGGGAEMVGAGGWSLFPDTPVADL